jgi:hypothetical protein
MDANTLTAICATAIAVVSLVVSISQARAAREHNRHAVRPLLELWIHRSIGGETGIVLANRGLGPAIITRTALGLDGALLGEWDEEHVNQVRDTLPVRPRTRAFNGPKAIPAGTEVFLFALDRYDRQEHAWFNELIRQRLHLEIRYESLYGGEDFAVALNTPLR